MVSFRLNNICHKIKKSTDFIHKNKMNSTMDQLFGKGYPYLKKPYFYTFEMKDCL